MAWTDDRIWCHPKFVGITDKAFRAYICANSYSSGYLCRGHLTRAQVKTLGVTARVRRELIDAGLWHGDDDGGIRINDWDEHNGKRDDRREKDRIRKQAARRAERQSTGTSAGQSAGQSTLAARVEGSEGSEGINPRAVTPTRDAQPPNLIQEIVNQSLEAAS